MYIRYPSSKLLKIPLYFLFFRLNLTEHQEKVLNSLKLKTLGKEKPEEDLTCIPKIAKGRNPLSCKKKKKPKKQ